MAWELILAIFSLSGVEVAKERAAMPARLWRGVEELTLACDVDPGAGLPAGFCRAALAEAARGAPWPVRAADGSGGVATLALRLTAIARDGRTELTVAGERAVPIDEAQGALMPRSVSVAPGESTLLALARALDGALPWRRKPRVPAPPREY